MIMLVEYGLPTVGTAVGHQAEAAVGHIQLAGDFGGCRLNPPRHGLMIITEVEHAGHVLLGDDQHMDGRLGIDVMEGHHQIVFVDYFGGYTTPHDVAENAVGQSSPSPRAVAPGKCRLAKAIILVFYGGQSMPVPGTSGHRASGPAGPSAGGVVAGAVALLVLPTFYGQPDEPVDEVRVGQAGGFPQLGVHADAGEAGNGVDL